MPELFENLERKNMSEIPRISIIPTSSVHPLMDHENEKVNLYNPGASRRPAGMTEKVPAYHAEAVQGEQRLPSQNPAGGYGEERASQYPAAGPSTRPSHHPRDAPAQRPSTVVPTSRPSTYPAPQAPPKIPSGFPRDHQLPIRQRTATPSVKPYVPSATPSTYGYPAHQAPGPATSNYPAHQATQSIRPITRIQTPQTTLRTKAPPSHEQGPDLESLLSSASIVPSHYPSKPLPAVPPPHKPSQLPSQVPARTEKGHTVYPEVTTTRESQVPKMEAAVRQSQFPGNTWLPSGVSKTTLAPKPAAKVSHSRLPSQTWVLSPSKTPVQPIHPNPYSQNQSQPPHQNTQSQIPGVSFIPSSSSEVPASIRPQAENLTPQEEAARLQVKAAEMLKRGPPKNVSASAFHQNPDGNAAREGLKKGGMSTLPEGEEQGKK